MKRDWRTIFRTFCMGDGKSPSELSLKPEHIRTWDECQDLRSFGGLLLRTIIDISLDYSGRDCTRMLDMIEEKGWHCLVLQNPSTEHIHIFWKVPADWKYKDGQDIILACGIKADIHHKGTYIPLRVGDVDRHPVYNEANNNGEYDEVPPEFTPVSKHLQTLGDPGLMGMVEHDGRNPKLSRWAIRLARRLNRDTVRSICRNINEYVFAEPLPESEVETILRDETFDKPGLEGSEKEEVNPELFKTFLNVLGMKVRYNELLNIVEYINIPDDMKDIKDQQNQMPTELQYRFRRFAGVKNIGKLQTTDLISLEADKNSYNPVRDYLNNGTWDGTDRFTVTGGIYDILGVTDPFQQSLIRKWFYQAAAIPFNEIENPFQPEGVLILQGAEGIGKTRFFSQLVPDPMWFASLDKELTTKNKDILIQILGAWISEIGEIDRTFKANKSDVKNFMTLSKDSIRKPYAREPVTKARTTAFCGTTNKEEFLNDDSGFRRWWVIPVNKRIVVGDFADPDNLQQFWAQCYQAYKENPLCFRLDTKEINTLEEKNKSVMETLPAEDELRMRLDFEATTGWHWVHPSALRNLPEYDVEKYSSKEIGCALSAIQRDCPEIKKGRDSRGRKYWIPPVIEKTDRYRNPPETA